VSPVFSDVMTGIFATNPSEENGGFLHIEFGACPDNKAMSCGTIKKAIKKDGSKNETYEHLGKLLVWNMQSAGDNKYKSGKIWDPSDNNEDGSKKIYNSKMALKENILRVDGCILFFCKGKDWTRVD
jgi:uncharacterized protein (DUF2147 family)